MAEAVARNPYVVGWTDKPTLDFLAAQSFAPRSADDMSPGPGGEQRGLDADRAPGSHYVIVPVSGDAAHKYAIYENTGNIERAYQVWDLTKAEDLQGNPGYSSGGGGASLIGQVSAEDLQTRYGVDPSKITSDTPTAFGNFLVAPAPAQKPIESNDGLFLRTMNATVNIVFHAIQAAYTGGWSVVGEAAINAADPDSAAGDPSKNQYGPGPKGAKTAAVADTVAARDFRTSLQKLLDDRSAAQNAAPIGTNSNSADESVAPNAIIVGAILLLLAFIFFRKA